MNLYAILLLWTLCGFVVSMIVIWIASVFFTHVGYDESNNAGKNLYWTSVVLGGPLMWIFAWWVEKEPQP